MTQDVVRTAICPHCGYDLIRDEIIVVGNIEIDPRGVVYINNKPLNITSFEHSILMSLIKANGRVLAKEVLISRAGSDALTNSFDVTLSRLKAKMWRLEANMTIQNAHSKGYRFIAKDESGKLPHYRTVNRIQRSADAEPLHDHSIN